MSRGTWTKIRQSNRFYVETYRWAVIALFFSVMLSAILSVAIYYVYSGRGQPDFYATDGVTPPVPLKALNHPNYSSGALLANDQNDNSNSKVKTY